MYKSITLNMYISSVPSEVYVISNNGDVVINRLVGSNFFTIRFCTTGCKIKIAVRHNNQIYYKKICLSNHRFQCFNTTFQIDTITANQPNNTFLLTDEQYGFPVPNAVLTFEQR